MLAYSYLGFRLLAFYVLISLPLGAIAQAGITADFSAGNTSFAVDGYEGMAGDGWTSEWQWGSSSTTGTAVVLADDPIKGGGNYLSVQSPGGGNREGTLYRTFGAYGSFDPSRHHIISFDLRVDDISAYALENSATWIRLTNADAVDLNHSTHTWWAGINSTATKSPNEWSFRNGTGVGNAVTTVASGIGLQEGVTYSFTFEVFPELSQYKATLVTSAGESFQSDLLYFRGERNDPDGPYQAITRAGTHLIFNTQKKNDSSIVAADFTYSIDNISIIPEPGSLALFSGGLVLMTCLLLRRRL